VIEQKSDRTTKPEVHQSTWTIVREVPAQTPDQGTSSNAPTPQAPPQLVGIKFSNVTNRSDKPGGQNNNGVYFGIYHEGEGGDRIEYLFKRGVNGNPGHTIAEYVASQFYQEMIPGYAAKCVLAFAPAPSTIAPGDVVDVQAPGPFSSSSSTSIRATAHATEAAIDTVYVGSEFELDERGESRYLGSCSLNGKKKRTRYTDIAGANNLIAHRGQPNFGLEKTLAYVIWAADNDTHSDNMGALMTVRDRDGYRTPSRAQKIDHDFSFYKLDDEIIDPFNPFAVAPITLSGNGIAFQPTNHAADYAHFNHGEFYFSDEFLHELDLICRQDEEELKEKIKTNFSRSLAIVAKTYQATVSNKEEGTKIAILALTAFAKHTGVNATEIAGWMTAGADTAKLEELTKNTADYLTNKMVNRWKSISKLRDKLLLAKHIAASPDYEDMIKTNWFGIGRPRLGNEAKLLEAMRALEAPTQQSQNPVNFSQIKNKLKDAEYATTLISILKNVHQNHLNNDQRRAALVEIAECLAEHAVYKYKHFQRNKITDKQRGLMAIIDLFKEAQPPTVEAIKKIVQEYPLMYQSWGRTLRKYFGFNTASTTERLVANLMNILPLPADEQPPAPVVPAAQQAAQPVASTRNTIKPGEEFYRAEQYVTEPIPTTIVYPEIRKRMDKLKYQMDTSTSDVKKAKLFFKWVLLRNLKNNLARTKIEKENNNNIVKIGDAPLTQIPSTFGYLEEVSLEERKTYLEDHPDILSSDELKQDKSTFDIVKKVTERHLIDAQAGFSLSHDTLCRIVTHLTVLDNRLQRPARFYEHGRNESLKVSWYNKRNFLCALHQASIEQTLYLDANDNLAIKPKPITYSKYVQIETKWAIQDTPLDALPTADTSSGCSFSSEVAAIIKLAKQNIQEKREKVIANMDCRPKQAAVGG